MSIEKSFDNESKEIINPFNIVTKLENPPEIAIVTFKQETLELLVQNYESKIIGYTNAGGLFPMYKINYKGKDIAIYRTVIGGAASAGLLEEVYAMGIKKFLFYGSCGVLSKDISEYNFIIPTEAYRDEGVSYHYAPKSEYIKVESSTRLEKIFNTLEIPCVTGRTWTTDAVYRETQNNMRKRKEDGCICVEMECASIMAVAQFRNIEVYQFLYAADNLDSEKWDRRVLGGTNQDTRLSLFNIALEVARECLK